MSRTSVGVLLEDVPPLTGTFKPVDKMGPIPREKAQRVRRPKVYWVERGGVDWGEVYIERRAE